MNTTTRERYEYWLDCYKEHKASGQTSKDFCKSRGLNEDSYRKAVSRYDLTNRKEEQQAPKRGNFIELTEKVSSHESIEIHYGLFCIRLEANVSLATLEKILRVLGSLS